MTGQKAWQEATGAVEATPRLFSAGVHHFSVKIYYFPVKQEKMVFAKSVPIAKKICIILKKKKYSIFCKNEGAA